MKILFLSSNSVKDLADWLVSQEEDVIYSEDEIKVKFIYETKPDFIISYNYRYIIPKEVINLLENRIVNLHISYLPWNRGAHPNVWSFLEDTPKGVTIHYIDEGIDTGDIIAQKEVLIDETKETLSTSYEILQKEMRELFKKNFYFIKTGKISPKKQQAAGSIHYKRDYKFFEPFIADKGWDTPIVEIKKMYLKNKGQ